MTDSCTMPASRPTLDLVCKAQAGDADALDRLFARYQDRVLADVRRRLGKGLRRHLESVDVLQQTFAKAWEKFAEFELRGPDSLRRWLAQIAERKIRDEVDRYRAAVRRPPGRLLELDAPASSMDSTDLVADRLPAAAPAPLTHVSERELQQALVACVAALPAKYREVIVLRNLEGLGWQEVAARSGRPSVSAAREMHRAALEELKKTLQRRGVRQTVG